MSSKRDVEDLMLRRSEDLCMLAEMIGYRAKYGQLINNNGTTVTSLLDFFDDNPGAMEAIHTWVLEQIENGTYAEALEEDEEEECDEEEVQPNSEVG